MAVFNTFTFDGENSLDYGIYITGEAVYNAPERAVEMVSIPGKNGALALDQGRFENIEVTYPAGTFGAEQAEFAGRMRVFRNMLASRYNYVRLTDSYHPDEYRLGLYKSGLEATPVAMSSAGEFDITFNCKPQRFLTSGEEPIDTSELGGEVTTDKIPYLFRRSGGGRIGHDFDAEIDKLIGGTVAWNQLVQNGNFADTTKWSKASGTLSVANNIGTFTATATAGYHGIYQNTIVKSGHKYLVNCGFKVTTESSSATRLRIVFSNGGNGDVTWKSIGSGWQNVSYVASMTSDWSQMYIITEYNSTINVGDTIEYKNIQLVDLTALFGSAEIADYVYSLEQTTAGAGVAWLKSHGFLTKDYYAYNAGSLLSVKTSAHIMRDENDVVIGNYPLDSDLELRGLFKLDANNNLYADGDVYESSGAVSRKYGIVDLGTLDWDYSSGVFINYTTGIDLSTKERGGNLVCTAYSKSGVASVANMLDYSIQMLGGASTSNFWIKDSRYTDSATFKSAVSGVMVVYELATPTTETADPYQRIQIVDNNGTEEYVDTRSVPIPVGHETKYGMSQLVLTNPTEFPSKPLLEITGVGTFWLGDTLFTITGTAGQTIYIDCETGEAWKNVGGIITPANGLVTLNRLDFPELDPGETPVIYGTGITKVVVTPRWWII